ncbi:MAG TPA: histidine kinase [Candidatus Limnocylindrales bacterium]|nr:histidine kinase [Candidatus Limnocylindrales bacterium]
MVAPAAPTVEALAQVTAEHVARLDRELAEIELLIQQARIEAARHEQKRSQVAERLSSGGLVERGTDPREQIEQLVTTTKRAALMQAQLDVLEGKQRVLGRFREVLGDLARQLEELPKIPIGGTNGAGPVSPEISRFVLAAQEDLRREIARQMHDGPAQSLTNIVLRAQIVEHLMHSDPGRARAEVGQLVEMVNQTLESTKTFIFDIRPMVLDDLGLVPTLRRAMREGGRRAEVPIVFESMGPDRRLSPETESVLFRVLDEAIEGFLSTHPTELRLLLDWSDDELRARVEGRHPPEAQGAESVEETPAEAGPDMPPALAEMINQRRAGAAAAATARARAKGLPERTWNDIRQRAHSIDLDVHLSDDGQTLEARLPAGGNADRPTGS